MAQKTGITDLQELIAKMEPILNEGTYVFTTVSQANNIPRNLPICEIKEQEGITLVLKKEDAQQLGLSFDFVAAWITLRVHSALDAVGLTAAFSSELGRHNISCNVIAGYYHDHIFVAVQDRAKAMRVLRKMKS